MVGIPFEGLGFRALGIPFEGLGFRACLPEPAWGARRSLCGFIRFVVVAGRFRGSEFQGFSGPTATSTETAAP